MTACANRFGIPKWRDLYFEALFETDRQKLPSCIASAERAVAMRAHELFASSGDNREEREGLEDALYALRALRHCVELRTNESDKG